MNSVNEAIKDVKKVLKLEDDIISLEKEIAHLKQEINNNIKENDSFLPETSYLNYYDESQIEIIKENDLIHKLNLINTTDLKLLKIKNGLIEHYNNLEKYFQEKDKEYKLKLEKLSELLKTKKIQKQKIYHISSQYHILQTISIKNIDIEQSDIDIIKSFDFYYKDNKRIYIIHSENITKHFENSKLKGRINQQNILNSRFRERILQNFSSDV